MRLPHIWHTFGKKYHDVTKSSNPNFAFISHLAAHGWRWAATCLSHPPGIPSHTRSSSATYNMVTSVWRFLQSLLLFFHMQCNKITSFVFTSQNARSIHIKWLIHNTSHSNTNTYMSILWLTKKPKAIREHVVLLPTMHAHTHTHTHTCKHDSPFVTIDYPRMHCPLLLFSQNATLTLINIPNATLYCTSV